MAVTASHPCNTRHVQAINKASKFEKVWLWASGDIIGSSLSDLSDLMITQCDPLVERNQVDQGHANWW